MSDDISNLCRVCLRSDRSLKSVFDAAEGEQTFADILSECTQYQVDRNELPQQICRACRRAALNAFKFKRKCEESYRQLVKKLRLSSPKIKLEKKDQDHRENIVCPSCGESFGLNSFLKTHITDFHAETSRQSFNLCHICKRQFSLLEHLQRHLALIHKIVLKPEGNVNGKTLLENGFNSGDDSNNEVTEDAYLMESVKHMHSDEDDDKPLAALQITEKPEHCYVKSAANLVLFKESSEHANVSKHEEKVNCKTEETADYDYSIDNCNMQLPNQIENPTFPCNMCSRVFKRSALLQKHLNTRHLSIQRIGCTQCEKIFASVAQYERHKESKHNEKTHKCSICEKTFTTKIYLQRHEAIHERKRYFCKECSQSYVTKEELNAHVKAEGHDKPLLCPECGLRCKTSNILMVHLRRHKGEKPFKCKFCSKGFPRMDDLRIHEKYHTGEKSHFCETCGKGFQRKYNLTIHLRVHTGEKPYKCPHCPQAFAQGNDLKAHIRRHTGERFRCEHCDAAFLQGYQIRQHKLTEHGIRENPPTQRVAKFTSTEAQELQIKQNLQKELGQSIDEKTIGENMNIELDSLPLDICEIQSTASDIMHTLETSDFSNIQF